jgi:NitT/TauT family transport system substrate-binding protein
MNRRHFFTAGGLAGTLTSCSQKPAAPDAPVRFGHFPNITHVQGLVAHQLSRQGKGWYESRIGVPVEWYSYNAGPEAVQAIFGAALDVTYIGPSPVLNGYAKSKGSEIRVLAGAANGGSAIVVRPGANIATPADFRGKKLATPQLGNTQDVQFRAWLAQHGIKTTLTGGGDAVIQPTQNPDQLALLKSGDLDAVWTVEPWVTRLEQEAGGKIFLEDKDTNVTLLAARAAFLSERADIAKKIAAAHRELTNWIKANAAEARGLVKAELKALTGKEPSDALLDSALPRVVLTNDISRASLEKMVAAAQSVGLLTDIPALDSLLVSL